MATLKMLIEVDCDDCMITTQEEFNWFMECVLLNKTEDGRLILHSNETGDEVGTVRVLQIFNLGV